MDIHFPKQKFIFPKNWTTAQIALALYKDFSQTAEKSFLECQCIHASFHRRQSSLRGLSKLFWLLVAIFGNILRILSGPFHSCTWKYKDDLLSSTQQEHQLSQIETLEYVGIADLARRILA